jgi:hypothetical protein
MADIDRAQLPTAEQAQALQHKHDRPPGPDAPAQQEPALSPDEAAALERAVADRNVEESRKQENAQANERSRTAAIFDREIKEKIAQRDVMQRSQQNRYDRENKQYRTGIVGVFIAVKEFFNPELAAAQAQQREDAAEKFTRGLAQERAAYIESLNATKERDLADLDERHSQQRREQRRRHEEDLARHMREQEEAKRLYAELKERQRQIEEQRARDGPKRTR